jgi:phosphatidylglycerophosphate synthase
MQKTSYYIINGITIYRIAAAPVLALLIIYGNKDVFKWMLAISFFTDAIDGFLARRFKVSSLLGAKLDSIGDDLTVAAGVVGMIVFNPAFFKEQLPVLIGLLLLFIIEVGLAFYRYGKMTTFHTYGAKIAAVAQGSFLILLFFTPEPLTILFYIAAFITAAELIEEILIVLVLPRWKANVKGLFWVLKKRRPNL